MCIENILLSFFCPHSIKNSVYNIMIKKRNTCCHLYVVMQLNKLRIIWQKIGLK